MRAQKIHSSILKTFGIVITDFQIENKVSKAKFFQKTFLITNIKFEIILEILFLKFSNIYVPFSEKTLIWRTYITNKALSTIK